jgi:hypothetical protein
MDIADKLRVFRYRIRARELLVCAGERVDDYGSTPLTLLKQGGRPEIAIRLDPLGLDRRFGQCSAMAKAYPIGKGRVF